MSPDLPGSCALCGHTASAAEIARHLRTCVPAHDRADAPREDRFHIYVEGAALTTYWLHLEVKARARLKDLDAFLRKTWLECCGHLSAFYIGRTMFTAPMDDPFGTRDQRSLATPLIEALDGVRRPFGYVYDFGSSTELTLRVAGTRSGALGRRLVRLLARNAPPVWACDSCAEPAELVCVYWSRPGSWVRLLATRR